MTQSRDPITVLIVEDSPTEAHILSRLLERDPMLRVVGVAVNGAEAIRMASRLHPAVITMDVNMPIMGGLEATEYIMAHQPTPILAVTASASGAEANAGFQMLSAGAVDVLLKPSLNDWQGKAAQLVEKVKLVSRIRVITHVRGKSRPPLAKPEFDLPKIVPPPPQPPTQPLSIARRKGLTSPLRTPTTSRPVLPRQSSLPPDAPVPSPQLSFRSQFTTVEAALAAGRLLKRQRQFDVVAIAASTGGPPALARLLKALPAHLVQPIFVVQHIPSGFSQGLASWLATETGRTVRLAENGEIPQAGVVYFAQDDRHLYVTASHRLALSAGEAHFGLRPSADVLFASIAEAYTQTAFGVILTGMGRDGANGFKQMHAEGAYTVAQDEASSVIFGMPKSAIESGAVDMVLGLDFIAPFMSGALVR